MALLGLSNAPFIVGKILEFCIIFTSASASLSSASVASESAPVSFVAMLGLTDAPFIVGKVLYFCSFSASASASLSAASKSASASFVALLGLTDAHFYSWGKF